MPLTHPPDEAQADFGDAVVVIAGVEQKAHYLAMDLPYSDDCFVVAFPVESIHPGNYTVDGLGAEPRR